MPSIKAVTRDLRLISESLNLLVDDPEVSAVKTKTRLEVKVGGVWRALDTGGGEMIFTLLTLVDSVSDEDGSDILKYRSAHRLALNVSSFDDIPDMANPPLDVLGTYITPALAMALHRAEHALLSLGVPTRLPLTPELQAKFSVAFPEAAQKTGNRGSKKAVATKAARKKSPQS